LRLLANRIRAAALGGLDKETLHVLRQPNGQAPGSSKDRPFAVRTPITWEGPSKPLRDCRRRPSRSRSAKPAIRSIATQRHGIATPEDAGRCRRRRRFAASPSRRSTRSALPSAGRGLPPRPGLRSASVSGSGGRLGGVGPTGPNAIEQPALIIGPIDRNRVAAPAQAGQRRAHRMREPAGLGDQLAKARPAILPQQVNHPGELRTGAGSRGRRGALGLGARRVHGGQDAYRYDQRRRGRHRHRGRNL
jgi:hypothetical protein